MRRFAVPEQATFARAHLEETEVLAVLRLRRVTGLAPRDLERLAAVAPAEDAADRDLRRSLGESSQLAPLDRQAKRCDRASSRGRDAPSPGGASCSRSRRCSEEPKSERWFSKKRMTERYFRDAESLRSRRACKEAAGCSALTVRGGSADCCELSPFATAETCVAKMSTHKPTNRAFRIEPPCRRQGRGPPKRGRSCHAKIHRTRTRTSYGVNALQNA